MKISILTPSYNYARFIESALVSTIGEPNHGRVDVEHVVMDGGSTDGTQDKLASCDLGNLKWRSEPDKGQSDALNKALRYSDGDIIGWLNADDFYLPGALETVQREFAHDPDLDVLIGDTVLVDERGRFIRLFKSYAVPRFIVRYRGTTIMSTSFFVRKSALESVVFDERLKRVMDWDLFLSILARDDIKVGYVSRPLGAFRFHDAQVTHVASNVVDGLPEEHHLIYRKHNIRRSFAKTLRPIATVAHKANKIVRGHVQAERSSHSLKDISLLDAEGKVDNQAFKEILRASYPGLC